MKRKASIIILSTMVALSVALTGCGKKDADPKEVISAVVENANKITSQNFKADVKLDLTLPPQLLEKQPQAAGIVSMFKNLNISIKGAYQLDPMQYEMVFNIKLKGDVSIDFNFPMIMTKEKMYIKVPDIPMLAGLMPESVVGKFVEMDFNELNKQLEEQGQKPLDTSKMFDAKLSQEFSTDISKVVLENIDPSKYFSSVDVKDAKLPEGVDAEHVIKMQVTNENLESFLTVMVDTVIPKFFDIITQDKYKDMFQMNSEDIAEAKKQLDENKDEVKKGIADIEKYVKINNFTHVMAVDEENYVPYSELDLNVDVTNEGQTVKGGIKVTQTASDFNKTPKFEIGIPKGEDVITMKEFQELVGGGVPMAP